MNLSLPRTWLILAAIAITVATMWTLIAAGIYVATRSVTATEAILLSIGAVAAILFGCLALNENLGK